MIIKSDSPKEGYYKSSVKRVQPGPKVDTKTGPCRTVQMEFRLPGFFSTQTQNYLAFPSNVKLVELFVAVLGECPRPMDTDLILGKECVVEIRHNTSSSGRVFANVVKVLPVGAVDEDSLVNGPSREKSKDAEAAREMFEIDLD